MLSKFDRKRDTQSVNGHILFCQAQKLKGEVKMAVETFVYIYIFGSAFITFLAITLLTSAARRITKLTSESAQGEDENL